MSTSSQAQLNELHQEIKHMYGLWERGEQPSPSTRDLVNAAVEIYIPDEWPSDQVLDQVANVVDTYLSSGVDVNLVGVAMIVRDALLDRVKALQ